MNDRRGGGGVRGGGRYHILIKNIAFEVDWKKLKDIIKVIHMYLYLYLNTLNLNFKRTKVLNQSSLKLWKIEDAVQDLVLLHFTTSQICAKHVNV